MTKNEWEDLEHDIRMNWTFTDLRLLFPNFFGRVSDEKIIPASTDQGLKDDRRGKSS